MFNRGDEVFVTWFDLNARGVYLGRDVFHKVFLLEDAWESVPEGDDHLWEAGVTLYLVDGEFEAID